MAGNICDEEGKPIFTAADILGTASEERGALDGPIVVALLLAMQEVNELGKTTNSQEKTSSGVVSHERHRWANDRGGSGANKSS
ncbi:MAG: hypothetical protein ACLR17_08215 [Enterobacteriaceae bacterium]